MERNLQMGPVTLLVKDLDRLAEFYTSGVGLRVLSQRGDEMILGTDQPVLLLQQRHDLPAGGQGSAGLYHTAFLFPSRAELAQSLYHTAQLGTGRYVGSADHLVSNAFYFEDPEGNGVELYWDRPEQEWTWNSGLVEMASIYLDPQQFLMQHLPQVAEDARAIAQAQPLRAGIGHVHLQVGEIAAGQEFYNMLLGLEITAKAPGAMFLASEKYHHHIAINTWNSRGAGPRANQLGLGSLEIELRDPETYDQLLWRTKQENMEVNETETGVHLLDPWRNVIKVSQKTLEKTAQMA